MSESEFYDGYFTRTVEGLDVEKYVSSSSRKALREYFNNDPKQGFVIDFGGRIGEKTRMLDNVVVVEVDKTALEYMRKKGIRCAASMDEIKDGSADVVFACHVLEHVDNPQSYLMKFREKLKGDGKLIIVSPAEFQGMEPSSISHHPDGHVHTFTFVHLFTMLERNGFEPLSWRYGGMPYFTTLRLKFGLGWLFDAMEAVLEIPLRARVLRSLFFLFYGTMSLLTRRVPSPEIVIVAKRSAK